MVHSVPLEVQFFQFFRKSETNLVERRGLLNHNKNIGKFYYHSPAEIKECIYWNISSAAIWLETYYFFD